METNADPQIRLRAEPEIRPIYTFKIPEKTQVRVRDGVKALGFKKLTADEEIMAAQLAHGDQIKNAVELLKFSMVAVNGTPVNVADGSVLTAINKMDPITRTLAISAYTSLHQPKEDEATDFLKSCLASV